MKLYRITSYNVCYTKLLRQHFKAQESLNSLKSLSAPIAKVIRDGKKIEIPSKDVVVGDILSCLICSNRRRTTERRWKVWENVDWSYEEYLSDSIS